MSTHTIVVTNPGLRFVFHRLSSGAGTVHIRNLCQDCSKVARRLEIMCWSFCSVCVTGLQRVHPQFEWIVKPHNRFELARVCVLYFTGYRPARGRCTYATCYRIAARSLQDWKSCAGICVSLHMLILLQECNKSCGGGELRGNCSETKCANIVSYYSMIAQKMCIAYTNNG